MDNFEYFTTVGCREGKYFLFEVCAFFIQGYRVEFSLFLRDSKKKPIYRLQRSQLTCFSSLASIVGSISSCEREIARRKAPHTLNFSRYQLFCRFRAEWLLLLCKQRTIKTGPTNSRKFFLHFFKNIEKISVAANVGKFWIGELFVYFLDFGSIYDHF